MLKNRHEPGLEDPCRVGSCKTVTGAAEPGDEAKVVALQVLEPAPDHVGGFLACARREVTGLNEADLQAVCGQGERRHGAVDSPTNHKHVESGARQPLERGRSRQWFAAAVGFVQVHTMFLAAHRAGGGPAGHLRLRSI